MPDERDALLLLDHDKGSGPGRRPAQGRDWLEFEALRALALEAAPLPEERLLREALERCRSLAVRAELDRLAGPGVGTALLEPPRPAPGGGRRLPVWLSLALAAGVVGAAYLAYRITGAARSTGAPTPTAGVPFEFPLSLSPVAEALAGPGDGAADVDDVHIETPADREARRLVRVQLQSTRGRRRPPRLRTPRKTPSAESRGSTQRVREAAASGASLSLSGPGLLPAGAAPSPSGKSPAENLVTLSLPQRRDIDVRLFSPAGASLRVLASGPYGPGSVTLTLTARDGAERPLAAGDYYLRVMTPWFSRVESVHIP